MVPLLRTTPTQLLKHEEVKLVPKWSLYPYILVSLFMEGTLQTTESERNTTPATKPLVRGLSLLPANYTRAMSTQNLWE